eukprot:10504156-Ditylum_brightwellii.AAC.1
MHAEYCTEVTTALLSKERRNCVVRQKLRQTKKKSDSCDGDLTKCVESNSVFSASSGDIQRDTDAWKEVAIVSCRIVRAILKEKELELLSLLKDSAGQRSDNAVEERRGNIRKQSSDDPAIIAEVEEIGHAFHALGVT